MTPPMSQRRRLYPALLTAAAAATLLTGTACDWSEFDALEEQAPVVSLERARGTNGFGQALATASDDTQAVVLFSGTPSRSPSAVYSLGFEQNPSTDPSQGGYCDGNSLVETCYAADQPAHFRFVNSRGNEDICFAYAWGRTEDDSNEGVLLRCVGDSADATLRVAGSIRSAREDDFEQNEDNQPLYLSSDRGSQPWLLAALQNQNAAWYYPALEPRPIRLSTPESSGSSFGAANAVLRTEDDTTRLFAVSEPEAGAVWLYRGGEEEANSIGCLGPRQSFGRALASGRVDEDEFDDLVVAEEDLVTVFSGAALAELPEAFAETCTLAALPPNAILGSFGCGSQFALSGCGGSLFGASLAVGDLDGDGDGEVVVGAPRMDVNGHSGAGALLVYDVEGNAPHRLADALYLSSAEEGDLMGTAVGTVAQGDGVDVVVGGGPGNSKLAVFYCSALMDPDDRQGRCAL